MRFSIIIPVYNREKEIGKAIDSVIQSDFKDYEVIIVNDGSSDGSGEICKSYATRYDNIRYFEKTNGGVASARNVGLKEAKGDFLVFLDSDDCFSNDLMTKVSSIIEKTGCDVCVYGFDAMLTNEIVHCQIANQDALLDSDASKRLALMLLTAGYIKCGPEIPVTENFTRRAFNAAFRRDVIEDNNINFFCFWNNEDDWIFTILALKNARLTYLCQDTLYGYTIGEDSLANKRRYIDNLYERRKAGIVWTNGLLDEFSDNENVKIREYRGVIQRKLILYTLYNETAVPIKVPAVESISCIRKAIKEQKAEGLSPYIMRNSSLSERVLFAFVRIGFCGFAYYLNKYVIKKYR